MSYIVNIEKSILTQKVSEQKPTSEKVFDFILWAILYFTFCGLIYNAFSDFTTSGLEIRHLVLLTLFGLSITYMTFGLTTMNKLHKFTIKNREDTRVLVLDYLKKSKIPVIGHSNRMIIAEKNRTLFGWGQRWIIIFDGDTNVYINCRTLGRYDIESPFHSRTNTKRVEELAKNFT